MAEAASEEKLKLQDSDVGDESMATTSSLVLIRNIPKSFHASDLRRFFSTWVETERFSCFHFRHRPEVKMTGQNADPKEASSTRCCIVRLQGETIHEFVSKYHGKHWTDEKSQELTSRCLIMKVKLHDSSSSSDDDIRRLSQSDLEVMPELRPPAMMPQGNVGTSTNFFLKAIRECRLPPKVISKLRLEFPVLRRNRKYGSVPFHYEVKTRSYEGAERLPECDDTKMRSGLRHQLLHPCNVEKLNRSGPQLEKVKSDSDADDDDDTCEEWERHESLHNDVAARRVDPTDISQQPGTKERLFEEEMEVVWEKGGSGLVFYTDAQYWKSREGDFDEQTTDDWDVDMSIYYEENAGDKDAVDSLEMRQSVFLRQGKDVTRSISRKRPHEDRAEDHQHLAGIGKFERHTRGFGRKILEKQGWREGQGLGKTFTGMSQALENEGQTDKSGLGYYGEKLVPNWSRDVIKSSGRQRRGIRDVIISTKFDNPESIDPDELVDRTNPQNYLSYK